MTEKKTPSNQVDDSRKRAEDLARNKAPRMPEVREGHAAIKPILIYQSEDGRTKLDVCLEEQTVWLNQKQLSELFAKAKGTISEHIKHIFDDEELGKEATVRLFRTVQKEGDREVVREVEFYNLDMILALGFRRIRLRPRCQATAAAHEGGCISKLLPFLFRLRLRARNASTKRDAQAFRTTTYANRACLRQFLRESMILCDLRNRAWKRGSELNPALGMGRMFSLRSAGSSLPPASAGGKKESNLPSSRLQPDFPALLQHFAPPSTLSRMNPPSRSPAEAGSSIRPHAVPPAKAGGKEEPARSRLRNSPGPMLSSLARPKIGWAAHLGCGYAALSSCS
jgi:hypothetical protein